MALKVRPAVAADAEAIARVHHAAVHETAAAFYPPQVVEAWAAKLTDRTYSQLRSEIVDPGIVVVVAEVDGALAGFGMVITSDGEVRAVYVHPGFGRRGVGSAVLKTLEQGAIQSGIVSLQVTASVNAETFYANRGYEVVERTIHTLRSGHEMACVKMFKVLQITYRESGLPAALVLELARRVWPREYDETSTANALLRTLNVTAWAGDRLVGCVRVLSDGYFFNVVTEIMVDPAYRRQGIGRELARRAVAAVPGRKLFLGAQPGNEGFFERCGFMRGPTGFVSG